MRLLDRLCCTVVSASELGLAARAPCGVFEVRADLFPEGVEAALEAVEELASRGKRVVFTLRDRREGGLYTGRPREKVDVLLRALDRGAWLVDAEYRFEALSELLESAGNRVLVSIHELRWPLAPELLYALAGDALRLGAAAVKLVTAVRRVEDNHRLLLLNAWRPGRIIAFGAGARGMLSRVLAPVYGSPLTYAALGRGAPGQPGYRVVIEAWRLLGLLDGDSEPG